MQELSIPRGFLVLIPLIVRVFTQINKKFHWPASSCLDQIDFELSIRSVLHTSRCDLGIFDLTLNCQQVLRKVLFMKKNDERMEFLSASHMGTNLNSFESYALIAAQTDPGLDRHCGTILQIQFCYYHGAQNQENALVYYRHQIVCTSYQQYQHDNSAEKRLVRKELRERGRVKMAF